MLKETLLYDLTRCHVIELLRAVPADESRFELEGRPVKSYLIFLGLVRSCSLGALALRDK